MEVRIRVWVDGKEIDLAPWAVSALTSTAKKASKPKTPPLGE